MRTEWATAMSRRCGFCTAEPRRACVIMNGNRHHVLARTRDGHAAAAHMSRAVVWEAEDMARPCAKCGSGVGQPCVTRTGGMAMRPHAVRAAASRLATVPAGAVVHVRNPANGGLALCGVHVEPHDPTGEQWVLGRGVTVTVTVRAPTCRVCRITERHIAARRDGCHDTVVPSVGQHATV